MCSRFGVIKRALVAGTLVLRGVVGAPAEAYDGAVPCWQSPDPQCAPNFDGYFPDDPAAAVKLEALWFAQDRDKRDAEEVLEAFRQGLNAYGGDRVALLRWVGDRWIAHPAAPHPEAIEIMFHALDDPATRGAAIQFGVTLVSPKAPNLLRALADVSIASDDPDELSRIAWAIDDQREEAIGTLAEYLASSDPAVREKAEVVRRIWRRELKAYDWARESRKAQQEVLLAETLPRLRKALAAGDSGARLEALECLQRKALTPLLSDGELACFAACASDPAPSVRALAVRLVAERWILQAEQQHPGAISIMMTLSKDDSEAVRHNAIYYGLSAVSPKDDAVLTRLLESAIDNLETELYDRIDWGLRAYRPEIRDILSGWRASRDPGLAAAGRLLQRDMVE